MRSRRASARTLAANVRTVERRLAAGDKVRAMLFAMTGSLRIQMFTMQAACRTGSKRGQ